MTVILKDIPGVTTRELLDALHDIRPDRPISTGHGGFVVDERTALDFLRAYLVMTGKIDPPEALKPEPSQEPEPTTDGGQTAKRRTMKKGAGQ